VIFSHCTTPCKVFFVKWGNSGFLWTADTIYVHLEIEKPFSPCLEIVVHWLRNRKKAWDLSELLIRIIGKLMWRWWLIMFCVCYRYSDCGCAVCRSADGHHGAYRWRSRAACAPVSFLRKFPTSYYLAVRWRWSRSTKLTYVGPGWYWDGWPYAGSIPGARDLSRYVTSHL